ncbi:MAG: hypothetical protein ABSA13_03795 [Beijerinckiaceae bacterium]
MLPTTILIDQRPRCVVRPTDMKDLQRFLRNAKQYLLAESGAGEISFREANELERARWLDALTLHRTWGGGEDDFFGLPL